MIEKKIGQQYEEWAKSYDEDKIKLFGESGVDYNEFMKSLLSLCELKPNMSILDVGAGTGLTSIAIAKALSCNCRILAVEPIDEMIERARTNVQQEGVEDCIEFKNGIGESLPCNDEEFDLVTCTFAIRHMDVEGALLEFERVLRPSGRIVIADICAPEKWRSLPGKIITPLMQFMISRKYKGEMKSKVLTVNEWKTLIEKLDLRIRSIVEFPGKREPEWEIKRVIMSIQKGIQ